MTRALRCGVVASLLASLLLSAACVSDEPELEVKEVAAAEQLVADYATTTLEISGLDGFTQGSPSSAPCRDSSDPSFVVQGAYQLLVPAAEQPSMLDRVGDGWRARGYTVTSHREYPTDGGADGPGGVVSATNPADGITLTLASGEPPAMLLLIRTKCYRPGEPAD